MKQMKTPVYFFTRKRFERRVHEEAERQLAQVTKLQELDNLRRQIELDTLQAQINPHFLYNALECIRGQAIIYHVPEIDQICFALSQFFRYSISSADSIATLRDEIENVKHYMCVQQFRFQDRLELQIHCEEEALLETTLPRLTLQPLVENAVIHGFRNKKTHAMVVISLHGVDGQVDVTVADNGCGMDVATLTNCIDTMMGRKAPDPGQKAKGNSIALRNVHRRISLLCGAPYGLALSSVEGEGTEIGIRLPRKTPGQQGNPPHAPEGRP